MLKAMYWVAHLYEALIEAMKNGYGPAIGQGILEIQPTNLGPVYVIGI